MARRTKPKQYKIITREMLDASSDPGLCTAAHELYSRHGTTFGPHKWINTVFVGYVGYDLRYIFDRYWIRRVVTRAEKRAEQEQKVTELQNTIRNFVIST